MSGSVRPRTLSSGASATAAREPHDCVEYPPEVAVSGAGSGDGSRRSIDILDRPTLVAASSASPVNRANPPPLRPRSASTTTDGENSACSVMSLDSPPDPGESLRTLVAVLMRLIELRMASSARASTRWTAPFASAKAPPVLSTSVPVRSTASWDNAFVLSVSVPATSSVVSASLEMRSMQPERTERGDIETHTRAARRGRLTGSQCPTRTGTGRRH